MALPLYVLLPNHYATEYGIPLAVLGAVLLAARLLDAVADPLIGRWADALFARSARRAWAVVAAAAVLLAVGFRALFFPAVEGQTLLLVWSAAGLALTYLSSASSPSSTRAGAHAWAATRPSARASWPGGQAEGAYFGWWSFATKLNLALAAGVALPMLQGFGYASGSRNDQALNALTLAYCLLPCALKLVAAGLLYATWIRPLRSNE